MTYHLLDVSTKCFMNSCLTTRGLPESQITRIFFFSPGISSGDYKTERKNKTKQKPNNPDPNKILNSQKNFKGYTKHLLTHCWNIQKGEFCLCQLEVQLSLLKRDWEGSFSIGRSIFLMLFKQHSVFLGKNFNSIGPYY